MLKGYIHNHKFINATFIFTLYFCFFTVHSSIFGVSFFKFQNRCFFLETLYIKKTGAKHNDVVDVNKYDSEEKNNKLTTRYYSIISVFQSCVRYYKAKLEHMLMIQCLNKSVIVMCCKIMVLIIHESDSWCFSFFFYFQIEVKHFGAIYCNQKMKLNNIELLERTFIFELSYLTQWIFLLCHFHRWYVELCSHKFKMILVEQPDLTVDVGKIPQLIQFIFCDANNRCRYCCENYHTKQVIIYRIMLQCNMRLLSTENVSWSEIFLFYPLWLST